MGSLSGSLSSLALGRMLSPSHGNKGYLQATTATSASTSSSDTTVASGALCLLHLLILHELDRLVAWSGDHNTSSDPSPGPSPSPGTGSGPSSSPGPSAAVPSPAPVPVSVPSPGPGALPSEAVALVRVEFRAVSKDMKAYKLAVLSAWAIAPALAIALRDR